jgi:2-polyprenyl-3-methyl-5-hydroxy-6-metoxy-1,4-benzoquinol methylase
MKEFWEQRYSEEGWAYGTDPNAFLATLKPRLKSGAKALVVGDGEGRNGVWLAQQGLDVLTVDYSAAGVNKSRELARLNGVTLRAECADLNYWAWPKNAFDVVVSIYLHFPPEIRPVLHRAMFHALKPGGMLIMEAFNKNQLRYKSGGPPVEALLFSAEILRSDFAGAEIELLEETVTELEEGKYHVGPGAVVRLVLRKPLAPSA